MNLKKKYYNYMNNFQKRVLLFLIGCIGTRSLLVYIAQTTNKLLLKFMGYVALIPAIGFFYIYLTGSRTTGIEVFGENIWWNNLRPIHGVFYSLFAYNAINGNLNAYIYLFADVLLGLVSFLMYHFYNKDF